MKYVKVISDNWDSVMTVEAYEEARLQMSTGDFHMHQAAPYIGPVDYYYDFVDGEFIRFRANQTKAFSGGK